VHFHGVTLDGEYTVRGAAEGRAVIERTVPITGLYLGACDSE
jgi:hypothetical protein